MWHVVKLAFAVVLLFSGCATERFNQGILSGHPLNERRMSAQPLDGFTPSGVWRIQGARNIVYLAGTSHIVGPDQVPFPSPYYAAYNDSKEIYVEYKTDSTMSQLRMIPRTYKWVQSHRGEFLCARGETIADHVSPETLDALKRHFGTEFKNREHFTPLFLLFTDEFEGGENSPAATGVEDVFMFAARRDRKPLHALDDNKVLDTVFVVMEEILAALRIEISERGADALIQERIINPDDGDPPDELWRTGDLAGLEEFQENLKMQSALFYEKGLVERNAQWLPRIEAALQGKRNVFILVGCAHLAGPDGLLRLLRDAGYNPEQLYGVDRPGCSPVGHPEFGVPSHLQAHSR